jgi:uncharacterized protein (DUF433 family)
MTDLNYSEHIKRTYGGDDPREVPLYTVPRASRYLKIPQRTIRDWVMGWRYQTQSGARKLAPVIKLPEPNTPVLSFMNLLEAHVLGGMRRIERVPFYKVRRALEYVEREIPSPHPLVDHAFETDGIDLFVRRLDQLIKVSDYGQIVFKEVVSRYLRRIRRDLDQSAVRLFPYLYPHPQSLRKEVSVDEPETVMIDPLISFGRPVLVGTGIPTDVVADRFIAGEDIEDLARDYGIKTAQVQEAVRYEYPTSKAA